MSKKVLVTGGAGFIGHQVIKELLTSTDWEILVVDRLSYAEILTGLTKFLMKAIEIQNLELILFIMI